MKMFFIFVSVAVLVSAVTFSPCEGRRIKRQIWPAPNNPNFYWDVSDPRDSREFYDYGDFWLGPPRLDQPPRNPGNFNPGGGRNDRNQNNQNNPNNQNNQNNQNRRTTTTTERLGPITSTPTTIHYAPRGCNCPMTQQFNPVCGTDGNTYRNKGLLNCYQRCGTNVSQRRLGSC